jgi:Zn-dependent M28 family amino/carboxypeptidase
VDRRKARNLALFGAAAFAALAGKRLWDMRAVAALPLAAPMNTQSPAAKRLEADVRALSMDIGPRNYLFPEPLKKAEAHVKAGFAKAGYAVAEQEYTVQPPGAAQAAMRNFTVVVPAARPDAPVLVVGAHYDSAPETRGADDNASGTAAVLELARRFEGRTGGGVELRFAAFSTEEPPFFGSKQMGSAHHAAALKKEGRAVKGMLSLEMLGYYSDVKGSQRYPWPLSLFYPDTADFIGLVSDLSSRAFLKELEAGFKPPKGTKHISSSLPAFIGEITLSDHKCYWDEGFPAILVSDTSFLRYPHYHLMSDTAEKLDYERMADVVDGLEAALERLRRAGEP